MFSASPVGTEGIWHQNGALIRSELGEIPLLARGKVRDIYDLDKHLLLVTTDRLSAFDCILPTPIPRKGEVLNAISEFWFHRFAATVPHHLVSANVNDYPPELQPFRRQLQGRSMLVRKAAMFTVECVARGYLSGSGWKEYQQTQAICGIQLPAGLQHSSKLPEPIFTPATKAQTGHDINISFEEATRHVPAGYLLELRETTLRLYQDAADYALERGIIIADTKFEFGLLNGRIVLADEVLTPDSSRFWPSQHYAPGGIQPSFDKQYVRDYLETLDWDKQDPAPALPEDVVERTSQKYQDAYRLLTGRSL
jgi:phosphoribosylaminoimidazole-succinocarboxamide synthase